MSGEEHRMKVILTAEGSEEQKLLHREFAEVMSNRPTMEAPAVVGVLVGMLASVLSSAPAAVRMPFCEQMLTEIYERVKKSLT